MAETISALLGRSSEVRHSISRMRRPYHVEAPALASELTGLGRCSKTTAETLKYVKALAHVRYQ
jgi:hypothetical protein